MDYGALTFTVQRATLRAFVAAFLHLSIVSRFALMILSSTTIASNCADTNPIGDIGGRHRLHRIFWSAHRAAARSR